MTNWDSVKHEIARQRAEHKLRVHNEKLRTRDEPARRWRIALYRRAAHASQSDIGRFERYIEIEERPSLENCDFFDETNKEYARYIR